MRALILAVVTLAACGEDTRAVEPFDVDAGSQPSPDSSTPTPMPDASTPPQAMLATVGNHGEVYYWVGGTKGTVLIFHGAGGSATYWQTSHRRDMVDALIAAGYSVVCATSVNRTTKQWSPDNVPSNPDVINVDGLLATLGVAANSKLFVIGHSNGGGFTTRYALLSARSSSIRAIQVSNSSGLTIAMDLPAYDMPTLFNYADCDSVVDAADVRASQATLAAKTPPVPYIDNDLDTLYQSGGYSTCHEFASTPGTTIPFFDTY